ncbi:MAG: hypothetical protein EYC70_06965 [Planctomycetota bacterium]|nr:MAG: hypothetical protein EYC70_06965 [Planctomycetota bacterium]
MPTVRRIRPVRFLPSLATLANLACGVGALMYLMDAARTGNLHLLTRAGWLLVLATVFDALDGKLARLTRGTSSIGAQLDSLADLVTFGVVPAMLARSLVILDGPAHEIRMHPRLLVVAPILYALCAALRLARFNVQHANEEGDADHGDFVGLPSPAAAALPIAMVLFYFGLNDPSFLLHPGPEAQFTLREVILRALPFVLVLNGALMVTRIRYPHFMAWLSRQRRPFPWLAEILVIGGLLLIEPELALLLASLVFLVVPALTALYRAVFRRGASAEHLETR